MRLDNDFSHSCSDFEVAVEEGATRMIQIQESANGLILPVRAQPGARKAGIMGEHNGALKLAVTAPADEGRANKTLLELLREELGLKRSQVELIRGDKSRDKKFLIRGLTRTELESRIARFV